jgi:hypothetical protein
MVESITFNSLESKIIVTLIDGQTVEYAQTHKDQYLLDYPSRIADVAAMGWLNT